MKTGIAHIPLDYGACPRWLFERMTRLGRLMTQAIIYEFGPEEFVRRMANPFFFQSFGSVLGFDWNSSGLTTTVLGALKYSLRGTEKDLGIFIAGGKGKTSCKTPTQIEEYGLRFGFDFAPQLVYASKMSAKVDSAALQDGFQLYHHSFLFTSGGSWTVIQQGMNTGIKRARRYHWHSQYLFFKQNTEEFQSGNSTGDSMIGLEDGSNKSFNFVQEPHSAVCSDVKVRPLNLVAAESEQTRDCSVNLIRDNFNSLLKDFRQVANRYSQVIPEFKKTIKQDQKERKDRAQRLSILNLPPDYQSPPPYLFFDYQKVKRILLQVREINPQNYEELLGKTNVGPATLRALALVAEIIYGAKPSYQDPVRYSFAHGGKDGYPYPVDREEYDKSISILERAVQKAKMGQTEKIRAFRKLAR